MRGEVDFARAVKLTGPAGSITIHHARTVHGSATNTSGRPRRLLLHQYRAADAWPILGVPDYQAYRALLLCGAECEPRLAPVPVRLPLPPAAHQGSIYENQRTRKGRFFQTAAELEPAAGLSGRGPRGRVSGPEQQGRDGFGNDASGDGRGWPHVRHLSRRSGGWAARRAGRRAGDLRRQQSHPRGLRRLCGAGLRRGRAGAVRPGRARRGARLSGDDVARGRAIREKVSLEQALADVEAAAKEVAGAGRIGVIGYCWGGTVAWVAATRSRSFAAAVSYYGGGVPDLADEQPNCPVQLHFGEQDQAIPLEGVERLKAAHPELPVYLYPAGHGFNCDQRASYHAESARLARERTLAFLREHIG